MIYTERGYKLAFYNSVIEILKRVQDDKECELVDFISIDIINSFDLLLIWL